MSTAHDREEILFTAALALPATERRAFLDTHCSDDPTLAANIETLLQLHEAPDDLEALVSDSLSRELGHAGSSFDPEELTGAELGPYRVAEKLGEGGTGIVYRAEQTAPIRRQVALKVLKPGMDTREILARFNAERQTLALMDHPGIARVLDAGATARGRPFFVMELVQGEPITRHCDRHCLSVRARLGLFLQVCRAVQHAHEKGVIHRDLKPSNLLVVPTPEGPQPKVIDFGIAKAIAGDAPTEFITEVSQFIGTPGYMSPEQAAGGLDLDTRSDVYALGVVLHELLTGRVPHDTRDLAQVGHEEIRRRIREDDAVRPSVIVAKADPAARTAVASARNTRGDLLVQGLRGELDWIILRCLEKNRASRYPSAAALGDDIRHHLHDEPVTAVAPSRLYVLRKSIRRHRLAYAAGALGVLLLAAATTISTSLAVRARRAEREAAHKSGVSQAVTDFLRLDVLAQASPDHQPDRDMKIRTALDNAAEKIGDRFAGQPLTEASIRETLGDTYHGLGDYEKALRHYESALRLRTQHLGPDDRLTLQTQNLAVRALRQLSRFAEAETLAGDALAKQIRVLGRADLITLETMAGLGAMRLGQGRHDEAESLLTEALARRREVLGHEHVDTLKSMNNLANCLSSLGRVPEAIALYRESLAIRLTLYGPEHPMTLNVQNNLAGCYSQSKQLEEAGALYQQVHETRWKIQGPEHPDTLNALQNLGSNRMQLGRFDEAVEILERARAGFIRTLGPEHPAGLMPLMNLAVIRSQQGRYEDAERHARACLDIRRKILGPKHFLTTDAMTLLGEILGDLGRTEEGETLLHQALVTRTAEHGADNLRTLDTAHRLALLLLEAGRIADARPLLFDTAERSLRSLGPDNLDALYIVNDAVRLHLLEQRPAEAEALALRMLPAVRQALPRQPKRWLLEARYGAALLARGQFAAAEPSLLAGYEGMFAHRQLLPPDEFEQFDEVRRSLVLLYEALARPTEATTWRDRRRPEPIQRH